MSKVSILMSVYNESLDELKQSVNSILHQTFKDFEFIIINDYPKRKDIREFLEKLERLDERVIIIYNDENIGLALSLNKGIEKAKSPYIARMDADDISHKDRISIQYKTIINNEYDLICTNYEFINAKSKVLNRGAKLYTSKEISDKLPFANVIHHPTVMLKKETLEKMGGYRNFDCAQDYDLWLRMLESNKTFYMLPDKLLKYRIRDSSVSVSKRVEQTYTLIYIRDLYIQRMKKGIDNYTYNNYKTYLENNIRRIKVEK